MKWILASASPRRRDLLADAGIDFEVVPADIDESVRDGEAPAEYVERMACEKADAVAADYPGRGVIAADTSVVLEDRILGKPFSEADAVSMLRSLSGRKHQVMTAFAVVKAGEVYSEVVVTEVEFCALSDALIRRYVGTGESMDKAGAYGIQGKAAGFVKRIEGSYTNVVGLPVVEVLRRLG